MSMFEEFEENLASKVSPTKLFPEKPKVVTMPEEVIAPAEYAKPTPSTKSVEEVIRELAHYGSEGIKKAREIYEKIKHKLETREIDKLEKEISELEEKKKEALTKAGLEEKKKQLEAELAEIKKKRLESIT